LAMTSLPLRFFCSSGFFFGNVHMTLHWKHEVVPFSGSSSHVGNRWGYVKTSRWCLCSRSHFELRRNSPTIPKSPNSWKCRTQVQSTTGFQPDGEEGARRMRSRPSANVVEIHSRGDRQRRDHGSVDDCWKAVVLPGPPPGPKALD